MNVGAADSLSPDVCLIKMIYCYAAWFCQGGSSEDFTMSCLIGWPLGDPELLGVLRCQTRFWRELHVEAHDALRLQERLRHPFTDRGKSGSCAWRPILLVWQKWIGPPSPQSFQVDQHWLVNPLEIFSDLKALNKPTDQTMYQIRFTKKNPTIWSLTFYFFEANRVLTVLLTGLCPTLTQWVRGYLTTQTQMSELEEVAVDNVNMLLQTAPLCQYRLGHIL